MIVQSTTKGIIMFKEEQTSKYQRHNKVNSITVK